MSHSDHRGAAAARRVTTLAALAVAGMALAGFGRQALAQPSQMPVAPEWRDTAQRVAQAGVPLSELAPNAPDAYTVQRGDTLWGISGLFLKTPWRWPELWGMNLEQIRNPHLIFPGQMLVLEKVDGRARLRVAQGTGGEPTNTVRLSPRVRSELLESGAIAAIPLHLIGLVGLQILQAELPGVGDGPVGQKPGPQMRQFTQLIQGVPAPTFHRPGAPQVLNILDTGVLNSWWELFPPRLPIGWIRFHHRLRHRLDRLWLRRRQPSMA